MTDTTALYDFAVTGLSLANVDAGDLTDYLRGKGYGPGHVGQLAVTVGGDGTVFVACDRDPTIDLQAYAPAALPAPIDVLQTLVTAFTGTAAQRQAAAAAVQAVLAAPARHRRQLVQGLG